jgi:hypothetical protein
MRHDLSGVPLAVLALAVGVIEPPFPARLVTTAGRTHALPARYSRTGHRAVAVTPIARAAQRKLRHAPRARPHPQLHRERHAPPRWTSRIDREKQNRRGGSRPSHGRSIHSAARSSLLRAASFRRRCRQRLYVDSPAKATKAEGEIPLGRPLERNYLFNNSRITPAPPPLRTNPALPRARHDRHPALFDDRLHT